MVNDVGALPISISNFSVSVRNCAVSVKWNFSNQVNGDYTELEQSTNGTTFLPVYRINFNGAGFGAYSVKVAQLQGNGYYRLKITDYTGKFRYSEVKFIYTNCEEKQKLQVFPTIVTTYADVVFTTTEAKGFAFLTVMDIHGRKMINEQVNIIKGTNRISIKGSSLYAGSYFIRIEGKDWKSETVKLIKE